MTKFYGIYRGTILNVLDPAQQGRVQVYVAAAGSGSAWALSCRPMSGGAVSPPSLGAAAWIMFEDGDVSRPVIMGLA